MHIQPLTESQLPLSVHAQHAWDGVSSKYAFVNTLDIVRELDAHGIRPYLARQSYSRIEGKHGYTKHLIRFRAEGIEPFQGGIFPEVWIINSHDTASALRAGLGLYRLICKNGLTASYGAQSAYRGIHRTVSIENVLEGIKGIVSEFPRLAETVYMMQHRTLNQTQREVFARAASMLRWDEDKAPMQAEELLHTRREEDVEPTVWNVFNTVQENLLQGQRLRTYGPSFTGYRRVTRTTRAVRSIDVDMSVNNGLWSLATQFASATA